MAQYLLRNTLNPGKVVSCNVTLRQIVNKGEEGESVWLIEVVTSEPHKDGTGIIKPVHVHYNSDQNLDVAIKEATEKIAAQVDWFPTTTDTRSPIVVNYEPKDNIVDIYSSIFIDIEDILPAAGIDLDSLEVIVNDIDVTDEVTVDGDPFKYRIMWQPRDRILEYEQES